jgi:hypothetical protein
MLKPGVKARMYWKKGTEALKKMGHISVSTKPGQITMQGKGVRSSVTNPACGPCVREAG